MCITRGSLNIVENVFCTDILAQNVTWRNTGSANRLDTRLVSALLAERVIFARDRTIWRSNAKPMPYARRRYAAADRRAIRGRNKGQVAAVWGRRLDGSLIKKGHPDSGHPDAMTGSVLLEDTGRSGGVQEISSDMAVEAVTTGPGAATPRAVEGSEADHAGGLGVALIPPPPEEDGMKVGVMVSRSPGGGRDSR